MTKIRIFKPEMIPVEKLRFLEGNSNKQNQHTFSELKQNIVDHGFDETLLVVPDGDNYTIVSGNHRAKAAIELGIESLPCQIRDDWDEVTKELQSVRRNYSRGEIDKNLFTAQVNAIKEKHQIQDHDIMEGIGFKDIEAFAELYKAEKAAAEEGYGRMQEEASSDANSVKIIDDLGLIISSIIQKYGDTVPHSFIIFPVSGKNHLYIQSNTALKKSLQTIAANCVAKGLDLNVALTGILAIGLAQTDFANNPDIAAIKAAHASDEDDADIEILS